jgi:hypothetical protein
MFGLSAARATPQPGGPEGTLSLCERCPDELRRTHFQPRIGLEPQHRPDLAPALPKYQR